MTTKWRDTDEADEFIRSGNSRETSHEIMLAIAFFARSKKEAESLWDGDGFGRVCNPGDLWEHVTGNGLRDAEQFYWGASGRKWWDAIKD